VTHARDPDFGVIGRRGDPHLGAVAVDRPPRQRHPVLPADQAADTADRRLDDAQVLAGADAVEQSLVAGGHHLAMPQQQAIRPEDKHRVVERARTARLAFVDADDAMHVVPATGVDELLDLRARHIDGLLPHAVPESVEPALELVVGPIARRHAVRPRVRGVQRDEHLRKTTSRAPSPAARSMNVHALATVAEASRMTGVACTAAMRNASKVGISNGGS
jgi:hypothetical protein